jgi:hypothetical protein
VAKKKEVKEQDYEPGSWFDMLHRMKAGDLSVVPAAFSGWSSGAARRGDQKMDIIRECLEVAAMKGTPALVEDLLQEMLVYDAALLLRAQAAVQHRMWCLDQNSRNEMGALPPEVVEGLDRVARIEERIVFLAQALARFGHVSALSRRGRGLKPDGGGRDRRVLSMEEYVDGSAEVAAE